MNGIACMFFHLHLLSYHFLGLSKNLWIAHDTICVNCKKFANLKIQTDANVFKAWSLPAQGLEKSHSVPCGTSVYPAGCFQKIGVPQNGWFILENPIKIKNPYFWVDTQLCLVIHDPSSGLFRNFHTNTSSQPTDPDSPWPLNPLPPSPRSFPASKVSISEGKKTSKKSLKFFLGGGEKLPRMVEFYIEFFGWI